MDRVMYDSYSVEDLDLNVVNLGDGIITNELIPNELTSKNICSSNIFQSNIFQSNIHFEAGDQQLELRVNEGLFLNGKRLRPKDEIKVFNIIIESMDLDPEHMGFEYCGCCGKLLPTYCQECMEVIED